MKRFNRSLWSPIKISLIYIIISITYIIFSDRIIILITDDPAFLSQIQTLKGIAFVLMSGLLVYYLVHKAMKEIQTSLKREISMKTLLTQDMQTKVQTSTGFMQLLEDLNLSDTEEQYLARAIEENMKSLELIKDMKKLSETEKLKTDHKVEIKKMLERAIEDNQRILEKIDYGIKEIPKKFMTKGDDGLKDLFSNLLKISIINQNSKRLRISFDENRSNYVIKLENDGRKLPKEIIDQVIKGKAYHGYTTGAGGLRFYILSRFLDIYDYNIDITVSSLNGVKYELKLPKV